MPLAAPVGEQDNPGDDRANQGLIAAPMGIVRARATVVLNL